MEGVKMGSWMRARDARKTLLIGRDLVFELLHPGEVEGAGQLEVDLGCMLAFFFLVPVLLLCLISPSSLCSFPPLRVTNLEDAPHPAQD